ncbi:MAG TPA: hypothetical protein V6C65_05365, partial [Allocoleopsis sp.]
TPAALQQWQQGVMLEGKRTQPAKVKVLTTKRTSNGATQTLLQIVLWEGRNRQIRRVAMQLGYPVVQLHRVAIGTIQLGDLPYGQVRPLQHEEVQYLQTQNLQTQNLQTQNLQHPHGQSLPDAVIGERVISRARRHD